ncbi:fatty acid desaturase [Kovacikia minuta CCNUW1]|uniref:fatty acid desaturase family protein n=1 Tax=Kovacikia minuta TaxID=2931930 RepID=UPI001CCB1B99|nr:fatty acid desaturase [Kovacikia minuta]UBF25184.1 fatty acid desaturase [Kovacikia minuta CCNUW1]
MIWRYSWRDSIPLSVTLFQLAINIWLAATWETRTLLQNLLFIPLCLFLFWYNGLVASHNFVHTPWFKLDSLNRFYLAINSINIGLPQAYYRHEHLVHHRFVNDRPDQYGQVQDPTSIFANGKNGQPENVISYCFLGLFRADLLESFRKIGQTGEAPQLYLELAACFLALIGYLILSWQYFLFLFLPTFYLGWVLEHLENYYEHFGGVPENKYANSTSYYASLYNVLFCNEGYHQEHHLRPGVHWTKRHQLRREFRKDFNKVDRVILRFPPALGFLDHRRIVQEQQATQPCAKAI